MLRDDDIYRMVKGDQSRPHLVFAFCRRHALGSFAVRSTRIGGKWGHTATWDQERQCFNESLVFKGVVETPYDEFFNNYSRVFLVAAPCPNPERGMAFLRGHADRNTPYDYFGAHAAWLRGDWQDDHRLYCSEKETLAWAHAGHQPFYDTPKYGVHPHDLFRAMIRTPDVLPLHLQQ